MNTARQLVFYLVRHKLTCTNSPSMVCSLMASWWPLEPSDHNFRAVEKNKFKSNQPWFKHKPASVLFPFYIFCPLFPCRRCSVCQPAVHDAASTGRGQGGAGVRWGEEWVGRKEEEGIRWLKATLQHLCWKTYELMMEGAADQKLANGGGGGVPRGGPGLPPPSCVG